MAVKNGLRFGRSVVPNVAFQTAKQFAPKQRPRNNISTTSTTLWLWTRHAAAGAGHFPGELAWGAWQEAPFGGLKHHGSEGRTGSVLGGLWCLTLLSEPTKNPPTLADSRGSAPEKRGKKQVASSRNQGQETREQIGSLGGKQFGANFLSVQKATLGTTDRPKKIILYYFM